MTGKTRHRALLSIGLVIAGVAALFIISSAIAGRLDKTMLESAASEALRRPVRITEVDFSVFSGIILKGVTVIDTPSTSDLLLAEEVGLTPSLWHFFRSGEILISSVRIPRARLHLVRSETDAVWNFERLIADLESGPSSRTPAFSARELVFSFAAPATPLDGLEVRTEEIEYDPDDMKLGYTITGFDGAPAEIAGTWKRAAKPGGASTDSHLFTFELSEVPSELPARFAPGLHCSGLEGKVELLADASGIFTSGSLRNGDISYSLPKMGRISIENILLKEFEWRTEKAQGWRLRFKDLRTGADRSARFSGDFRAADGDLRHARLDWDARVEEIARIFPPSLVAEILRLRLRGPSVGYIVLNEASLTARDPLDHLEFAALARGCALRINSGMYGLPDAISGDFRDIRGRIQWEDKKLRFENLSFAFLENPVRLDGHARRDASEFRYDFAVSSPGFQGEALKPFLPDDLAVTGPLVLAVHLKDDENPSGSVEFQGNALRYKDLGSYHMKRGKLHLASNSSARLEDVRIGEGEEDLRLHGSIGADSIPSRRSLALEFGLERYAAARLPGIEAFLGELNVSVDGGAISGSGRLSGRLGDPVLSGTMRVHDGALRYRSVALTGVNGIAAIDSNSLASVELAAAADRGRLEVKGSRRKEISRWDARFQAVNMALASEFLPASLGLVLSGPASGRVQIVERNTEQKVEGVVELLGTNIALSDSFSVLDTKGNVEFTPDRITFQNVTGRTALVAGSGPGAATIHGSYPLGDSGSIQLALKLSHAQLDDVNRFLPEGIALGGVGQDIDLRVAGSRSTPILTGHITLRNGTLRAPFLAYPISAIDGRLAFAPDSFFAERIRFRARGSQVELAGAISRLDDPIAEKLTLRTMGARIEDLTELLSPELRPLPEGVKVTGEVVVDSLSVHGPIRKADWRGKVRLANGTARLDGLAEGLTALSGVFHFNGATLSAPSCSGVLAASPAFIEATLQLSPPYALDLKVAVKDADIATLFAALPGSREIDTIPIKGRGALTAEIRYTQNGIAATGSLFDGTTTGFGMDFTEVEGAFRYDGHRSIFSLENLRGRWAGGRARDGRLELRLSGAPSFSLRAQVDSASLARILTAANVERSGYSGIVSASLQLAGRFDDIESLDGGGSFTIAKGLFPELKPLDTLSRSLKLDFFSRGTYDSVRGAFTIERGVIRTSDPDHFRFAGRNYALETRGYVELTGQYAFNYRAAVQAGLAGHLLTTLPGVSGKGEVIHKEGTLTGSLR